MAEIPAGDKRQNEAAADRRKLARAKKADVPAVTVPFLAEPVAEAPALPSAELIVEPLQAETASLALDRPEIAVDLPTIEVEIPQPKEDAVIEAAPTLVIAPEVAVAAPAPAEPASAASNITADIPAAAKIKGSIFMATIAPDMTKPATERFQAMFGDVNERAKTAFEKSTKIAEELGELTKGNVEALVASGRVAAKGAEALTQEAAEYSKKSFETATGAMRGFAAAKSPVELIQLQNDFAKTSFDAAIAEASKLSESWVKLAGDVFQPLSSRFAVAAEKLKATSL